MNNMRTKYLCYIDEYMVHNKYTERTGARKVSLS